MLSCKPTKKSGKRAGCRSGKRCLAKIYNQLQIANTGRSITLRLTDVMKLARIQVDWNKVPNHRRTLFISCGRFSRKQVNHIRESLVCHSRGLEWQDTGNYPGIHATPPERSNRPPVNILEYQQNTGLLPQINKFL